MKRTTMVALTTDVEVACDASDIPSEADIRDWAELALGAAGRTTGTDVEVAFRIVDADEMQSLNRRFRDQDKPTNVLSFPAGTIDGLPEGATRMLGDVVICASVVENEANEQGKTLADHWGHMIVHGTLHLLGYDHDNEPDAIEMEALETQILASRNVTDPYAG